MHVKQEYKLIYRLFIGRYEKENNAVCLSNSESRKLFIYSWAKEPDQRLPGDAIFEGLEFQNLGAIL